MKTKESINKGKTTVFVDTSMFKALVDEKDEFYKKALKIWERLRVEKVGLVTSNYVLDEAFTLIRARRGISVVKEFRQYLAQSSQALRIMRVSAADEAGAWDWFKQDWSNLSFTDCVSFALMKRLGVERVATFDKHFGRAGFKVEK